MTCSTSSWHMQIISCTGFDFCKQASPTFTFLRFIVIWPMDWAAHCKEWRKKILTLRYIMYLKKRQSSWIGSRLRPAVVRDGYTAAGLLRLWLSGWRTESYPRPQRALFDTLWERDGKLPTIQARFSIVCLIVRILRGRISGLGASHRWSTFRH